VLGDEPVVHRVLGDAVVIVGRAFHAGEALVGGQRREDVAAGRQLDAVAAGVEVHELVHRIAAAGPQHPDDLAARLVLERVEQALGDGGEVGGVGGGVFLVVEAGAGLGQRLPERRDAVAAEGVVLRQRRDMDAGLADRHRVRDRVLRRVAAGAEDVAVPLVAGDLVGHRRLDDQDLLVFFGDRQHGDRRRR
jgi:hypothetical protein